MTIAETGTDNRGKAHWIRQALGRQLPRFHGIRAFNARSAVLLAGGVLALDLVWSLLGGSVGSIAYGLVDEPAHLATCAVALLTVAALAGSLAPEPFVVAALIASVAIDFDHVPGILGWRGLEGPLPRPYSHSILLVAGLVGLACLVRRRDLHWACAGLAFGVSAHLFRDLATGPGVSLLWPVSDETISVPYMVFAAALFVAIAVARAVRPRAVPGAALACVAALVLFVAAASAQPPGESHRVALGAYVYSADHPGRLSRYARTVGREPVIVSSYKSWGLEPFPRDEMEDVWNHGAVPLVTWEPWTYTERPISLRGIAAGRYDRYVHRVGRSAAAWGRPILVRFAHEMNGDWYPWGRGRDGNTPRIYRKAWKRLVRVFRTEGASNVEWVWTPNVNNGSYPFAQYFPGDEWVDWVGLDGFNWGTDGQWRSFTEIFGPSYEALGRLSTRPMIVAETASNESGGDKAAWVASALRREIPRFSRIRGVVWFSEDFEDIAARVNSSRAALHAFRSAIASPTYSMTRREFLETSRSGSRSATAPPAPDSGFGQPSLLHRLLAKLHGRNLFFVGVAALALALAAFAAFILARRIVRRRRWERARLHAH